MSISRVPGADNLYVGGIWILNLESWRSKLYEYNITHVLSVIKFSFENWGEEAKRFRHMSIDIDDVADSDILVHFSSAVRFIDGGLYPPPAHGAGPGDVSAGTADATSPGAVFVHCAMGKSRSVSCVVAYLLYKYPHRFGGKPPTSSPVSAAQRHKTAKDAVQNALKWVRQARSLAEPNDGFMHQLELWWEMGCPADDDSAVERHPVYQKWLYGNVLKEARYLNVAPDAEDIRFEDEVKWGSEGSEGSEKQHDGKEVRCKKCRRMLATPGFVVPHTPVGQLDTPGCAHIFVDTLSWMRPALEGGALEGRLSCPNPKCGATVGRFAWQGLECSCREWVAPAFSLNRGRVDQVTSRRADAPAIRLPPGRNGSL
ncbi:dual specificity protein phosphatase 12 [Durotheca rogersii]|uniref:dual specificity protein phosphatase 12 n=1 Tax=Durotheca rogersii TaxID=419775 RepID=UPI00221EE43A|nr:dual specificity protein phosphatase 12 [Durotheca rogersii]KAI5863539.1 dual specificity protein phosphatase 12 [Durotheca rogersii]